VIYKHGVDLSGLDPAIWYGLGYIESLYNSRGYELVVTSGREGVHSVNSLHGKGKAVDIRSKILSQLDRDTIVAQVRLRFWKLGYDFIYEDTPSNEHFHFEFDPKPTRDKWQIVEV
jgi:hypothetical protein